MTIEITPEGKLRLTAVQPPDMPLTVDSREIEEVDDAVFMGRPCARVVTRRGASYVVGAAETIRGVLREIRAVKASDDAAEDGGEER